MHPDREPKRSDTTSDGGEGLSLSGGVPRTQSQRNLVLVNRANRHSTRQLIKLASTSGLGTNSHQLTDSIRFVLCTHSKESRLEDNLIQLITLKQTKTITISKLAYAHLSFSVNLYFKLLLCLVPSLISYRNVN